MWTRWSDFDRTFAALEDFRRRMDRMFSDYYQLQEAQGAPGATDWPRMSLQDEGNAFTLYAEVPGLSEKEIELSLNQDVLSISGERRVRVPEGYSTHRQERGDVRFSRSFTLPCAVDPEKARATVKDGILTVSVEKAAEARPRQISIKAG